MTSAFDFITSVELADRAGVLFMSGDNVAKDAELRLTYEFAIPNNSGLVARDTYTFSISDEILINIGFSIGLEDNSMAMNWLALLTL